MDPIGRNTRLPQARNEVAEKRTRASQVDVGLGQRDAVPQPIHDDPPGMGRDVCAALVKSIDDDISVARRGVLHLPGQCVMCRTACSVNIMDRDVSMPPGQDFQHADHGWRVLPHRVYVPHVSD